MKESEIDLIEELIDKTITYRIYEMLHDKQSEYIAYEIGKIKDELGETNE